MSVESTRAVIERYIQGRPADLIDEDAVYRVMGTGQEARGRDAVLELLRYFYAQAFDAKATQQNLVVGDGRAVVEYDFQGRQKGEFMGIAPSDREVHVPLCVVYEVGDDKIRAAHIYFETDALRGAPVG